MRNLLVGGKSVGPGASGTGNFPRTKYNFAARFAIGGRAVGDLGASRASSAARRGESERVQESVSLRHGECYTETRGQVHIEE